MVKLFYHYAAFIGIKSLYEIYPSFIYEDLLDNNSNTPLHTAIISQHEDISLLLFSLVNSTERRLKLFQITNYQSKNILHLALEKNYSSLISALFKFYKHNFKVYHLWNNTLATKFYFNKKPITHLTPEFDHDQIQISEEAADSQLARFFAPACLKPSKLSSPFSIKIMKNTYTLKKKSQNNSSSDHQSTRHHPKINIPHESVFIKGLTSKADENSIYNEIMILSMLNHPNIVKFYGVVEHCKQKAMVLSNSGVCLSTILHSLSIHKKLNIALQVASALVYLHTDEETKPPIRHGDIRAANILIHDKEKNIKAILIDFEEACIIPRSSKSQLNAFSNFIPSKRSDYPRATCAWISPEILSKNPAGLRADVYSFGMFLFELFTNTIPFENLQSIEEIKQAKLNGKFPFISVSNPLNTIAIGNSIIDLMKHCWISPELNRPTIIEIKNQLEYLIFKPTNEPPKDDPNVIDGIIKLYPNDEKWMKILFNTDKLLLFEIEPILPKVFSFCDNLFTNYGHVGFSGDILKTMKCVCRYLVWWARDNKLKSAILANKKSLYVFQCIQNDKYRLFDEQTRQQFFPFNLIDNIIFDKSILLGTGASGEVYKMKFYNNNYINLDDSANELNDAHAAVKVMNYDKAIGIFMSEITLLTLIEHENIVHLYGILFNSYNDSVEICLAMELAKFDIITFIKEMKPNLNLKLKLIKDICNGLCYLREINVVHRDIKGGNILIFGDENKNPIAKIGDLGFAIVVSNSIVSNDGTDCYKDPELISDSKIGLNSKSYPTCASDIYSFGIVMFEIFCEIDWSEQFIKLNLHTQHQWNDESSVVNTFDFKTYAINLMKTKKIPDDLINLVSRCWRPKDVRPSPNDIHDKISKLIK